MKTSNILEQESHLRRDGSMSRKSSDVMAKLVTRKIPRPRSPVPHDHTDPIVRVLAPNSDTASSQPTSQSQLSQRLSNHVQAEVTHDNENSQELLLRGNMVDLKARECPFFDLLRVREILERTHKHRYSTYSSGEPTFGNPKPITIHPDLHQLSECSKRDGGAGCVLFSCVLLKLFLILHRNILKDKDLRQQVNDSAEVVQNLPTALPERPRSPISKRNIEQPMRCSPDTFLIASYMHKWEVDDYSVFIMTYLNLTI